MTSTPVTKKTAKKATKPKKVKVAEVPTILKSEHDKTLREVEKLKKQIAKLDGSQLKPEQGDEYYHLDCTSVDSSVWNNGYTDEARYKIGNCFLTYEAATRFREKLAVTQKLRELAGGIYPNGYPIIWDGSEFDVGNDYDNIEASLGTVRFKTSAEAREAIKKLGVELYALKG